MSAMNLLVSAMPCMLCGEEPRQEAYIQRSAESIQQLPHLHHEHIDIHPELCPLIGLQR